MFFMPWGTTAEEQPWFIPPPPTPEEVARERVRSLLTKTEMDRLERDKEVRFLAANGNYYSFRLGYTHFGVADTYMRNDDLEPGSQPWQLMLAMVLVVKDPRSESEIRNLPCGQRYPRRRRREPAVDPRLPPTDPPMNPRERDEVRRVLTEDREAGRLRSRDVCNQIHCSEPQCLNYRREVLDRIRLERATATAEATPAATTAGNYTFTTTIPWGNNQ